ncbi:MAG: hypothetical protein IJ375_04510 [Oscillospiraceae bacterium]|nr:hypothetical protein [Oscillospiraceae bacterium]
MKHTAKKEAKRRANLHVYRRAYPNAADPSYFVNKAIDTMLAVVTGMGSVTALLFLITM